MQKIKLNLTPGKVAPVCYASQGDVGLAIRFLLFDGETALTLSGTEVITLAVKKADGSELEESVTNTGSNYVDVITTADTCDTPGASLCELRFQDGGDDLGTGNFIMEVEADAYAGANIEERTASGIIANFETNLQDNLTACKCEINALQSGSGTPSPNNPRPISGFNGATISVADENMQVQQTYAIPFGQKVYGGVLDVTNGKLTIKYVRIKISDMTWTLSGDFFYSSLPLKKYGNTTFLCECLRVVDVASVTAMVNGDIKGHPSNTNIYIKYTDWTSASDLYNAIGDYYIVYELATPTEITLTAKEIEALLGTNNIYHDCNGETEVGYLIEV